jgi:hypothetical protein
MRAAPQGDACQGCGVSGVSLVGSPRDLGRPLWALSTPGTRATPWHAGCQGLSQARRRGGGDPA